MGLVHGMMLLGAGRGREEGSDGEDGNGRCPALKMLTLVNTNVTRMGRGKK